ncbi:CRISPR-associated helicase Cas3' [Halanaerobium sp. MA284_MarDTE_T2]|uniref:CRISPR-associated helicase Cas3' n=1 Tax=Halanaerobium sp. MA284_MarDTE_T2 TaxID=2183913 RepID=UPI000E181713|nr:CRISPR-associated helicase Cas3' [Halanaerobium sp. MA284_MarDTE_T2]RCW49885.1 CRISPR-associated Cas3 family helicase [Halanaerobium sp. MA284_MarDTE_T2]
MIKINDLIHENYLKTNSGKTTTNFSPFKYQKEVAKTILGGQNVILQAPTGAGKTLASILPFIIANEENYDFPKKLIYSTPRRTLVNSLFNDISKEINKGCFNRDYNVTVQTGEHKEDRYFTGDIVFTTFDQSLSSALSMPISLSNRLANINVAAVLSSYLIFDEFHLFDLEGSYTTTVLLLEKLKEIVPFCIMTATLSNKRTNDLADKLDAKVIRADQREYLEDIVTQKGKERRINVNNRTMNAEEIFDLHTQINGPSKKSIVMCNRVDNAQKIYSDLKSIINKKDYNINLILIHSRFLNNDRSNKEKKIKKLFNKKNSNSNVILVSTQVIEVGIDITSDIMHTEISSIDSFLQRIGRCARYQNEKGEIFVYDVLNDGKKKYLPYDELITLKTFKHLEDINGQILTSEKSQEIIDQIYSKETNIDLQIKEKTDFTPNSFIIESWSFPDKKRYKDLIRDVVGCNIIIKKWIVDGDSPYNYQSLSISPWTLKSKIKGIEEETSQWSVKQVIEQEDDSDFKYTYKKIDSEKIYANETYLLNPEFFAYDKENGLLFNQSGIEFKRLPKNQQEDEYNNQKYKEESYLQHINSIKSEVDKYLDGIKYLTNYLKKQFNLNDREFKDIIELTIWAHDLGKLQKSWQEAHKKNEFKYIAHGERISRPPGHAGESFWIALCIIEDFVFDYIKKNEVIIDIIGKSIVSHHSINLNKISSYSISEEVINYFTKINHNFFSNDELGKFMNQKLDKLFLTLKPGEEITDLADEIRITSTDEYLFYFLLIRILRLSDQEATKNLNKI